MPLNPDLPLPPEEERKLRGIVHHFLCRPAQLYDMGVAMLRAKKTLGEPALRAFIAREEITNADLAMDLARTFRREQLDGVDVMESELAVLVKAPPAAARALLPLAAQVCSERALDAGAAAARDAKRAGYGASVQARFAVQSCLRTARKIGAIDRDGEPWCPGTTFGLRDMRLEAVMRLAETFTKEEWEANPVAEDRHTLLCLGPKAAARALLPLAAKLSMEVLTQAVIAADAAAKAGLDDAQIVARALEIACPPRSS